MIPHVCPVCRGNGLVPNGFYTQTTGTWGTTSITPEKCRSCNGTGVVWESKNHSDYEWIKEQMNEGL